MNRDHIYAIELPNGLIKFGTTNGNPVARFKDLRAKYGLKTKPLGLALGGLRVETELKRFLRSSCVRGEVFRPDRIVKMIIERMGPFPPVPPPHKRLLIKFASFEHRPIILPAPVVP